MKILIFSQHYWPENFRITDISGLLVENKYKVTVICGLPNYPHGFIFDEYKHGNNRNQKHNGVNIFRVKEIARRSGIFFRFLNYWSYPHYASKLVKKFSTDFDVVLVNGLSPIMSAKPAIKYAKRHNKPLIMYEMDLWPESLLAGGVKKNSFIYNHYKKVSSKIYSQFNKILVSTKEHIDYIKDLPNCGGLDIEYLPQYAESIFEDSSFEAEDNGVIDLMFAGNIGKAQSVETIIKAAALLKDNRKYKFHIVGSGSELENVKRLASELKTDNVIFYGQKPIEEMPSLYKLADAMLVTLEDKPYANMTIPGKVQSYMAVGKPIIGCINGSTARLIEENKIGYVCQSEDYNSLAQLINSLNEKDLIIKGKNARAQYLKHFSRELFMSKLTKSFEELINAKQN